MLKLSWQILPKRDFSMGAGDLRVALVAPLSPFPISPEITQNESTFSALENVEVLRIVEFDRSRILNNGLE
jgi:hypothetical protein